MTIGSIHAASTAHADEVGAPGKLEEWRQSLPLELRLEVSKCLSRLSLDFIKRLNDVRPLGELYRQGEMALHVHFAAPWRGCAYYRAVLGPKGFAWANDSANPEGGGNGSHELPVLVWIRDGLESPCPVASVVRLQTLEHCDMALVDTAEPTSLFLVPETLGRVFDDKLCAIMNHARIKRGKLENEIIKRGSAVVANLSDQDAEAERDRIQIESKYLTGIRIELFERGFFLHLPEIFDGSLKLAKVFVCPADPFKGAVERMNSLLRHHRLMLDA